MKKKLNDENKSLIERLLVYHPNKIFELEIMIFKQEKHKIFQGPHVHAKKWKKYTGCYITE